MADVINIPGVTPSQRVNPVEELKVIETLQRENIDSCKWLVSWIKRFMTLMVIGTIIIYLFGCSEIAPDYIKRCIWADTNEECAEAPQ